MDGLVVPLGVVGPYALALAVIGSSIIFLRQWVLNSICETITRPQKVSIH